MRTRRTVFLSVMTLALLTVGVPGAGAANTAVARVRAVYRSVLNAEYFGPAAGVCSHLGAAGVRSFTAGGSRSCTQVFLQDQHILRHKTRGIDQSGYTPAQWRREVNYVMGELKVTVTGSHASAIGVHSGIPGRTTLVEVGASWVFSSSPPSVGS